MWSAPVAFRRVALETPEWTSRDSNHHRQSVSAGKTNAIPTEPSGRLSPLPKGCSHRVSNFHIGESRVRGVGIFAVLDQLSYLGLTGKFGIWTGDTSGRKVACSNFMVFDDDRDEIKLDETFSHLDSEVGHVNKYL